MNDKYFERWTIGIIKINIANEHRGISLRLLSVHRKPACKSTDKINETEEEWWTYMDHDQIASDSLMETKGGHSQSEKKDTWETQGKTRIPEGN